MTAAPLREDGGPVIDAEEDEKNPFLVPLKPVKPKDRVELTNGTLIAEPGRVTRDFEGTDWYYATEEGRWRQLFYERSYLGIFKLNLLFLHLVKN